MYVIYTLPLKYNLDIVALTLVFCSIPIIQVGQFQYDPPMSYRVHQVYKLKINCLTNR